MLATHVLPVVVPGAAVLLAVGLLCLLLPRRARRALAMAAVPLALAGGAGAAVVGAETPLGVGDGTVPSLVGRPTCEAEVALEERGLRWRYGGSTTVYAAAVPCPHSGDEDDLPAGDPVTTQRPAPGSRLPERGVVVVETACAQDVPDGTGCG